MLRIALAALLISGPALAQAQQPPVEEKGDAAKSEKQERDRTGVDDMARDAAMQPLVDTNLKRRAIPATLEAIGEDPYSLEGLRKCTQVNAAIVELDGVLGPDLDAIEPVSKGEKRRRAAGEVAKGLVGGLIPFRGLVREITGASDAQRRYHAAIEAGLVRRAFLKGYATARKCKPPIVTVLASEAVSGPQASAR